jgi:predicted amidohydrolase
VGVYGMGALSAGVAAALAALRARSSLRALPLLLTLPLALAGTLLPSQFSTPVGTLRVSLLQPAVPQSQKFDAAHVERNLDRLLEQMEAARAPLVVAPESVLPLPLAYVRAEQQERLYAASRERTIWFGTFLGDERQGFVNSMLALRQGESVHSYGKRHLLPFGEFIPPGLDWFVRALNIPIDSQQAGTHQRPLQIDGLRLRALICYEVLFGEDIAASAVDGPDAAEVFVNTSNLAWFGRLMVHDADLPATHPALQDYWGAQGCALLQPYDMEVGAGTSHTATFLRALGPEPWKAAYVQPSRRPRTAATARTPTACSITTSSRSCSSRRRPTSSSSTWARWRRLGFDLKRNDVRFVEDDWENPTLGCWGLGWEVWLNGMEVTQFTYFQQVGGIDCRPITGEITYGLERLAMYLQGVGVVYDLVYGRRIDVRRRVPPERGRAEHLQLRAQRCRVPAASLRRARAPEQGLMAAAAGAAGL